ncbi:hypothetical protein [Geoalkalibacter halelectricus]|uniref:hypothetical protein n=1 Tax=Geoalkalibacter halelectricus TaxID=2847045 RepID=UPI003D1E9776
MNATHAQTHWDSALVLFRQLQALKALGAVDAEVPARNEYLLRMHLHVLARCDWDEPQADKPEQVFVKLARRLSSPVTEVRRDGYALACAMLVEGGDAGEGAFAALAMLADDESAGLMDLYRNQPALRPRLFDLWREQGWKVPQALLNQAELQGRDDALQEAALAYAATRPEIGVELFRPYYAPLHSGAAPRCSGRLTALALWGALVRGERGIEVALRRAVERETDAQTRLELLRLAALAGDAEMLPVLHRLLDERPEQWARLLALHGSASAVEILIEALSRAATMDAAARAWPWISGQALPSKPRLRAVGREDGQGAMPDVEAARDWWAQQRSVLPPTGRMLQGAPLSLARLHALALTQAGEAGRDLLDLLALHLGRPLGFSPRAEQARRRAYLENISMTDKA